MRISTTTVNNMANTSVNNSTEKYYSILKKISDNKNFTKVSENVNDSTKVLKLKDQISKLENYQDNIQTATNEMNLAYDTLGNVTTNLNYINELVIQAADATTTPASAKAIAVEIKERVNSISDEMNTKYMDNFIFSGTYIQEQAYQEIDGVITYCGSNVKAGERNLNTSDYSVTTYNVTGEEIFGSNEEGNDFFSQMKELNTLLNADELDYDAIRDKLNIIQSSISNVSQAQGCISSEVSKLETSKELNESTLTTLTGNKAELEEVDITQAASDLASAQTMMQASYLISSQVLQSVSLMDYL